MWSFFLAGQGVRHTLLFGLGYIKAMRNKYKANLGNYWMSSQLSLLPLVYFFLNPHSSPRVGTNMSGGTHLLLFPFSPFTILITSGLCEIHPEKKTQVSTLLKYKMPIMDLTCSSILHNNGSKC